MTITEFFTRTQELFGNAKVKATKARQSRDTLAAMYWNGVKDATELVMKMHPDMPSTAPIDQEIAEILKENISYSPQVEAIVIHGAIEKLREREKETFEKGFSQACRMLLQYNRMWNDPEGYRLPAALKKQQKELLENDATPLSILFDFRPGMAKRLALAFATWVNGATFGLIRKNFDDTRCEGWRKVMPGQPDLILTDEQLWEEWKKYYHANLEDIFDTFKTH